MDYKIIYKKLIESRKLFERKKGDGTLYEKHHIIPKCLGGSNDIKNLILLTPKEHFIAHYLLIEMYEGGDRKKMYYAFWRMCNRQNVIRVSSRQYEYGRKCAIEAATGRKQSEETKTKLSTIRKTQIFSKESQLKKGETLKKLYAEGKKVWMHGKNHTEQWKQEMSEKMSGRIMPEYDKSEIVKNMTENNPMKLKKNRDAMSQRMKGKEPWNKGKVIETTCPHCGKKGNYRIMPRWHFENCKVLNL
jgi:hypothetical protein